MGPSLPLRFVWVAIERRETMARVRALVEGEGCEVRTIDLRHEERALQGCQLAFVEERSSGAALHARIQALAAVDEELMVVPIVSPEASVRRLLDAGAFDVVVDDASFDDAVVRAVRLSGRFVRRREELRRLHDELAHQDRLSAIGMLAAGVGHEVNNPNSAILVNLEAIRSQLEGVLAHPRYQQIEALQQVSSDWLEALGDSIGASRRITSIVRALNVFSRREDDERPVRVLLNVEVSNVLRLIGKEVRFQAQSAVDLAPDLPAILAPSHAVTQVLTNLVVNALQALETKPREERRLGVRTAYDDQCVMLEVTDNGPGIPPGDLGRVFDPFFTTKRSGTGLGLSITREIVQKMNGEIFVDSAPGRGATFRVVFERAPEEPTSRRRTSWVPPGSWRARVLIVDDDALLLRSLSRTLAEEFECIPVSSGEKAVAFLKDDPKVDVVLSDIVMPGTNGLELYEAIQAEFPELADKTIFISGGVRSEELRARIALTGRPCVAKPFEVRELVKLMRAIDRGAVFG